MPWKEVSIMSQRLEFVTLAMAANANIRHLCRCFGISPATAYKWLDRFQAEGASGLEDRSRRPHNSPWRTPAAMEASITKLRAKHPAWGGRKLETRLLNLGHTKVPSASTITAILQRHQLLDPKNPVSIKPFSALSAAPLMSSGRWTSKANSNCRRAVVIRSPSWMTIPGLRWRCRLAPETLKTLPKQL